MDPIIDYRAKAQGGAALAISRFMSRVYGWMTFGLVITGVVSYVVGHDPYLMQSILGGFGLGGLIILQLALVFGLSLGINKMSVGVATFCFLLYSFTNGVLFSTIFQTYALHSISQVFLITAGSFLALAGYGSVTKRDLTAMGSFLIIGLFGVIIASVVNMFLHSSGLDFGLSVICVFVFAGLTAYDTQKIKTMATRGGLDSDSEIGHKLAIIGALTLYLDFINLFLSLLRIFGDRRR